MQSALEMLFFAIRVYVVSLILAVGAVYAATHSLRSFARTGE
jgi:hypothetical protein